MKILLDIIILLIIVLGTWAGVKKGLLKTLVGVVGLVAIVIISYSLRVPLANFLIDTLPFFEFGVGLTALNVLVYNVIAFVVIFVLLYCLLNIIITLTGFIDTLLKFTVIWIIPSKIGGGILGFIESWVFVYLILFVLVQFSFTNSLIGSSKVANFVLDHTPIVGTYLGGAKRAAVGVYETIAKYNEQEDYELRDLNRDILSIQVANGLISKDKANELVETGKMKLEGVLFG